MRRDEFPQIRTMVTRWLDYDMLRHINNVEYYRYFEHTVLENLRDLGTDWIRDPVIPFVVENGCQYQKPLPVAPAIDIGLRIGRLGNSSVRYELALFEKDAQESSAFGFFVHVYVHRDSEKPAPIPPSVRKGLADIVVK